MTRHPYNILLVEDHVDSAEAMARFLVPFCRKISTAGTCEEARRVFENDREIDLLIMDIGLPDGDGCDLLRELAAIRHVPAIALTAYAMATDIERTTAAGFIQHISKPVVLPKLIHALRHLDSPSHSLDHPSDSPWLGANG